MIGANNTTDEEMGNSGTTAGMMGDVETTAGMGNEDTTAGIVGDVDTTAGMGDEDTTAGIVGDVDTAVGMGDEDTTAGMGDRETEVMVDRNDKAEESTRVLGDHQSQPDIGMFCTN